MMVWIPDDLLPEVKQAVTEAGMCGPLSAFSDVADCAAVAACWGKLLMKFASYYHVKIDKSHAVKICSALLMSMGGYFAGCRVASGIFRLIPGAGTLAAMGVSSLANMVFTFRYATALTMVFGAGDSNLGALVGSLTMVMAGMGSVMNVKEIVAMYRTT